MEHIHSSWEKKGGPFGDDSNRMKERKRTSSKPESQGSRRKGQAAEDLGSGFVKKGGVGEHRQGVTSNGKTKAQSPGQSGFSTDEIDFLSQTSDAPRDEAFRKKKGLVLGPDGKQHVEHPQYPIAKANALKGLKFKKTKSSQGSAPPSQRSDASSSTLPVLKENGNAQRLHGGPGSKSTAKLQGTASQTSNACPSSPLAHTRRKLSPSPIRTLPSAHSAKPTHSVTKSENTRPKPRPIGNARVVSTQAQPASFLLDQSHSPRRRRNTVSTGPNPPRDNSRSPTANDHLRPLKETLAPAPFPRVPPISPPPRPADLPTLPALGPHAPSKAKLPPHGKRSSAQADFVTNKKVRKPGETSEFPLPSPLSNQTATGSRKTTENLSPRKKSSNRIIPSDEEESEVEIEDSIKPQPFPMSTQDLGSIGSPSTPPTAGPSRPGKRSSSERRDTESDRDRKKTRKEDDMCVIFSFLLAIA
jgi:hypothetical protein